MYLPTTPPITTSSKMAENGTNHPETVVIMVPLPAQGHLNQLLHLSRLIAAYNLPVHIISSTIHTRQAKSRIHGWDPLSLSNLHFHDFPTPDFPSPPPDPTAAVKFPTHLIPSFRSSFHLRQPFVKLLSALSPTVRRVVVIHDYLTGPVVQDVVNFLNAEAYMFSWCSAFASFWYYWEATGTPALDGELEIFHKQLPSADVSKDAIEFIASTDVSCHTFTSGTIHDASRVIERKFIELLEAHDNKMHWALGPFNPVATIDNSSSKRHGLFHWLDKQAPNSVVYVSFGTTTSIANEQIREIALGLEQSGQKFIWVLRDADKGNIFEGEVRKIELPEGFEERVETKKLGVLARDWVPQLEILGHPSTGAFMSHCGWNSSMEGITMGVPIAAWPMHSDQPMNAMLITKVLKVGVYVRDWARREELVTALMVEEAIRTLMVSEEREEIRKRAAELGGNVRESMAEGGVTRAELDSFIAHVSR